MDRKLGHTLNNYRNDVVIFSRKCFPDDPYLGLTALKIIKNAFSQKPKFNFGNFQMSSSQSSSGGTNSSQTQSNLDNKSDQCNPNNPRFEGHTPGYSGTGTKADLDNHGNQLNPNNERYQTPKK